MEELVRMHESLDHVCMTLSLTGNVTSMLSYAQGQEPPDQPATVWLKIWKYPLEYLCGGKLSDSLAASIDGVKKKPGL